MPIREVLSDGSVRFRTPACTFVVMRLRPGVVLALTAGHDTGEFGHAVLEEFALELRKYAPIQLFVDTTLAFNATQTVAEQWSSWLAANRPGLQSVNVLTASKFVHLTISIAKLFSRTGETMRLYTDGRAFEEALGREIGAPVSLEKIRLGVELVR